MVDYVYESIHDLLAETSEGLSDSSSNEANHNPSCEYFMAGSPDGHLENNNREFTPPDILGDRVEGGSHAPRHHGPISCGTTRRSLTKPCTSWKMSALKSGNSWHTEGEAAACMIALER